MRLLTSLLLSAALSGPASALEIRNDYFLLDLPGDWRQEDGDSPEQLIVVSESRKAQITLSYVPMAAKEADLQRVAEKLLKIRPDAEREAAPDRTVFLDKPWSSRPADGGIQVNYFGHDSLGRHFFFAGFVTTTQVTSVTGELELGSEAGIRDLYQEVLSHFGY